MTRLSNFAISGEDTFIQKAFFSEYSLEAPGRVIDSSVSALVLLARFEERIAYSSRREIAHSSHGSVGQEMLGIPGARKLDNMCSRLGICIPCFSLLSLFNGIGLCAGEKDGKTIVLIGARLIDGTQCPPVENARLVIEGDKLTTVAPADSLKYPDDARVRVGSGLWSDTSPHTWFRRASRTATHGGKRSH
jgi:hypothetical protein